MRPIGPLGYGNVEFTSNKMCLLPAAKLFRYEYCCLLIFDHPVLVSTMLTQWGNVLSVSVNAHRKRPGEAHELV